MAFWVEVPSDPSGDLCGELAWYSRRTASKYSFSSAFASPSSVERARRVLIGISGKCSAGDSRPRKTLQLTPSGSLANERRQVCFFSQSPTLMESCHSTFTVRRFGARRSILQIFSSSFRLILRRLRSSNVPRDGFMTVRNMTPIEIC